MGATINRVDLPADVQRLLPPGTLIMGFDGEVLFRNKDLNSPWELRSFTLNPITNDNRMHERRWKGPSVQNLCLIPIEHFHGQIATVYYAYVPDKDTQRTGLYRINPFAAYSWSTQQWIQVNHPGAIKIILEGSVDTYVGVAVALTKFMLRGGKEARLRLDAQNVAAIDGIAAHVRHEMMMNMRDTSTRRL
jgi:hypothetical protein